MLDKDCFRVVTLDETQSLKYVRCAQKVPQTCLYEAIDRARYKISCVFAMWCILLDVLDSPRHVGNNRVVCFALTKRLRIIDFEHKQTEVNDNDIHEVYACRVHH